METILEQRSCRGCQARFAITDADQRFYDKLVVPRPTLCPDCREQRRLAFHNELCLYKRRCAATGEQVISNYSPEKPYTIYKQSVYWSDTWDAKSYGREFDFSRPFFPQLHELWRALPQVSLFTDYLFDENSDFTNYAGYSKNCYLIAHADYNQDCYYGYGVKECRDCCDVYNVVKCELCYEVVDCYGCYDCKFSQDCLNCAESFFLRDCVGCKCCFGCQNLRQKEYWIWNRPVGRAAFEAFVAARDLGSYAALQAAAAEFEAFSLGLPHRHLHMTNTDNCVGDQLVNCKNVSESFENSDLEDGKYCSQMKLGAKDCMDVHQFGSKAELMYECAICGQNSRMIRFSSLCYDGSYEVDYSANCQTSHNIFGCVNLRRAEYCILNKQYRRDEFFERRERIIAHMQHSGEWGEFFPPSLSPFGYNETRALECYPLSREQALQRGFNWKEEDQSVPSAIPNQHIPDHIREVTQELCRSPLACEVSGKNYRITPHELNLYRKINVPVPRRSIDQRYRDRQSKKNPRRLWQRPCASCATEMITSYAPERREIVYCATCYESVVE